LATGNRRGFPLIQFEGFHIFFSVSRLLKKTLLAGCSKTFRYKASEIQRSEAYMIVRRNDEG
jgi:hypothetical protein